jgi:hypothetical protein
MRFISKKHKSVFNNRTRKLGRSIRRRNTSLEGGSSWPKYKYASPELKMECRRLGLTMKGRPGFASLDALGAYVNANRTEIWNHSIRQASGVCPQGPCTWSSYLNSAHGVSTLVDILKTLSPSNIVSKLTNPQSAVGTPDEVEAAAAVVHEYKNVVALYNKLAQPTSMALTAVSASSARPSASARPASPSRSARPSASARPASPSRSARPASPSRSARPSASSHQESSATSTQDAAPSAAVDCSKLDDSYLNLENNSSIPNNKNDAKKNYLKLALIYHPDKTTGDIEKFKKIAGAWEVVSKCT